ncbi:excinuclease ABC subunit C [Helicobacter mustelae]|nr:excinuclease ABC subunit C [Helicobacter mustelae]
MRNGKIIAADSKRVRSDYDIDIQSLFTQYLLSHYKHKLPLLPQAILVSEELEDVQGLQNFLQDTQGRKIPISVPKSGFKKNLIHIGIKNARELLRQEANLCASDILIQIKESFALSQTPFRIEVFDTSHHAMSFNVGGMIVYDMQNFDPSSYRHYNLQSKDEYAQMREMLLHRIKSFTKSPPPNLWIIDGGRAQLNLAQNLLESAGYDIDILAISKEKRDHKAYRAKGYARDRIYTKERDLRLDPSDKRLQFLQKLRDESHRFAIKFHRSQKTKNLTKNLPYTTAEQKRLLQYFGDFAKLQSASAQEISQVLRNKPSKKTQG